jgi:TetR/AcrR family transcriptional regulator, transcriptional repressor for nem operon
MSRRKAAPKSRAEAKQATREALIAAGLEELATSGLDASLDDICRRADLTRGAFYVHFADRDAFLLAVMTHVLGGFVKMLTTAASHTRGIGAAIELFFTMARARAPAIHGGRGLRFFHLLDACHRSKPLGDAYRATLLAGRDQLAAAIEGDEHARKDIRSRALADLMIVAALGIVSMFELEIPLDLTELERTVSKTLAARR